FFFFFFQAEDGIRDFHVTGVQTCALPIYNLVSSKIGDFDDEWFILFDQKEHVSGRINFDVEPEITHIEYDIHEVPGSEDIKQSTWIQLINPIPLKDKYSVKEWPKITREFPDKPVIVRHQATQQHQDGHKEIEN